MRIIAGHYRGRVLKSPPSMQVRPTSDRLRETLFNVLAPRIGETRFLDLCAGSGAIGIEALSREASHVTFVDRSRKMCGLVEANLDMCRVPEDMTEVVMSEAAEFLRRSITRGSSSNSDHSSNDGSSNDNRGGGDGVAAWDIVFYDPPYDSDYLVVLKLFGAYAGTLLREDAVLIAEHHHKTELRDEVGSLRRWRILKQGDSCLSFYETS